jgi:FkbM family methyltransferase
VVIYKLFSLLIKPLVGSGIGKSHFVANLYQKIMLSILPKNERIIEVEGFRIKVLVEGYITDIATELLFKHVHEPITTNIFKKLIKTGDCVVDIGANVGYFTLLASKLVGWRGKVFSFEPEAGNMKLLKENIGLNKFDNIEPFQIAVSDKPGRTKFYTSSKESAKHSLIHINEHDGSCIVEIEKLDDIIDKSIKINFLKTDTEGNELAVLQGAEKTILRSPDIKVLLEVYEYVLNACGIKVETLWDYLVGELKFKYIYMVDDYAKKIIEIYSPNVYKNNWRELGSKSGKDKLACNLLCSRTPFKEINGN